MLEPHIHRESTRESSRDTRLRRDVPVTLAQSTALEGANKAFGKPPVKPKPQANTYSGNNGALAAATKTSRSASRNVSSSRLEAPVDERRLAYQRSGESNSSGQYTPDQERRFHHLNDQSKSPSFIAATLAASRSPAVTPNHTGQQQSSSAGLYRQSSFSGRSPSIRSVSSRGSLVDQPLDTSSIPPTNSLIGMFEQNAGRQPLKKKPAVRRSETADLQPGFPEPQMSPTPVRARRPSPLANKTQKPEIKSPKPILPATFQDRLGQPFKPKPLPAARNPPVAATKPIPVLSTPERNGGEQDNDDASSEASFNSVSNYNPSFRVALQNQKRQQPSNSPGRSAAAIEAMANAIVASSLASSRAASPSRSLYPPPPPPRRSPHKHLFHNAKDISRAESPVKVPGLRTTMRKPKADDEVDEGEKRRGRKKMMRKHPNKHHEGDRKRWRDEITERERKRYEAVWASNKGQFMPPGSESLVCSLVVRDIYSRSRLHHDVLEEVYALVDRKKCGGLEKEEFVVGLWLIDQRLKGRKLPIRVSNSVWGSVGALGLKVQNPKMGK